MSSESEEDPYSEVGFSSGVSGGGGGGSTATGRTQDENLTLGDTTASYDQETQQRGDDSMFFNPAVVVTLQGEEDGIAVAMPPMESDGAGEYHEVALTGSAALDALDMVIA